MQKAVLSAVFLVPFIIWGIPTQPDKGVRAISNSSTPVRVLLERETKTLSIKSVLRRLYVKDEQVSMWRQWDGALQIVWHKRGNNFWLNAPALSGDVKSLFIRGGPYPSDKVQYKTEMYRGAIRLQATAKGILVTNLLTLDDYVMGILAHEMSPSWEIEALKAQAVASRTYAVHMIAHPKNANYDVESTTQDQVYGGASGETEKIRQAVLSTSGQLLSQNDKPIKSYFHSRCGGTTETAQTVWNEKRGEHRERVPCPYCQKNPYVWKTSVPLSEFFGSLRVPQPFGKSFSLLPTLKTPTGRIASLMYSSGATAKQISGDELRNALGYARIKSTQVQWKIEDNWIHFEGVGAGHGVGMCQWGAKHLAKQGKTHREILAHYYPGAELSTP